MMYRRADGGAKTSSLNLCFGYHNDLCTDKVKKKLKKIKNPWFLGSVCIVTFGHR